MEGDPRQLDERFAEWYVWAKREVSTDGRVCLGAAQAAFDALAEGADEQAARVAARGSTAGHGIALVSKIPARRRAYAEWYDWARRNIGGGRELQHTAARAALERLDAGADATEAAAAAQAAVTGVPPAAQYAAPSPAAAFAAPATPVAPAPLYIAPYVPQAPYAAQPPAPVVPMHVYAGFGRRAGAWLIDAVLLTIGLGGLLLIGLVFAGISLAASGQDITNENVLGVFFALLVIDFVLAWLYYAGLESSGWQGTIGKRVIRIVVTDDHGRRIGFGAATGRYFARILSTLAVFVGYLMVLFTKRRQGLHDLLAGTVVVRKEHLALLTSPPPSPPPEPTGQPASAGEAIGV